MNRQKLNNDLKFCKLKVQDNEVKTFRNRRIFIFNQKPKNLRLSMIKMQVPM